LHVSGIAGAVASVALGCWRAAVKKRPLGGWHWKGWCQHLLKLSGGYASMSPQPPTQQVPDQQLSFVHCIPSGLRIDGRRAIEIDLHRFTQWFAFRDWDDSNAETITSSLTS
jgi:hypothetical protein